MNRNNLVFKQLVMACSRHTNRPRTSSNMDINPWDNRYFPNGVEYFLGDVIKNIPVSKLISTINLTIR